MAKKSDIINSGFTNVQAAAIQGGVATGLTAAGSTAATAAPLQAAINVFSTVAASTGVRLGTIALTTINAAVHGLSTLSAGDEVTIINQGANALTVYPPSGGKISNGTADASVSIAVNGVGVFLFINNKDCHRIV